MLTIEKPGDYKYSFLHLGFRPFFLLAGAWSAIGMALWLWIYISSVISMPTGISPIGWHAHEMIYGFAMAVVSGFLLTAIRNWTGIQTLSGWPLASLALLWLAARFFALWPVDNALLFMAAFDIAFNVFFLVATAWPLVRARQWKQLSIWSKLVFLLIGNVLFYAGVSGWLVDGVRMGLYTGLYIIVSLILLMARRVLPFFIEKRLDGDTRVVNRKWVDMASLVLVLVFLVTEVYWVNLTVAGITALLLGMLHLLRMSGWYAKEIWKSPMLWVLYLGYGWLAIAFLIRGLNLFVEINPMLIVHAFAVGGIGMITLGMMARVALGHTGRDVYAQPAAITLAFILVGLAAVFRVLMPLLLPGAATYMVVAAQTLWILGFAIFVVIYLPFLVKPRVDGRYG